MGSLLRHFTGLIQSSLSSGLLSLTAILYKGSGTNTMRSGNRRDEVTHIADMILIIDFHP
jgi:hypothetical protein